MLHQLINHSPDLRRLWDEGLEIEIKDGYLLVHRVPYINSDKEIKYGTLVTTLNLAGDVTVKPETHVVYFIGEYPCNKDGTIIKPIKHESVTRNIGTNITVNHSFSNKPQNGYADYYEKIMRYVEIISAPAKSKDNSVTERTFKIIEPDDSESVFNYTDTNSTRAEINTISQKLENQKVAIIGLGGTGSYTLDLIAKNHVKEIHLYDGDTFLQHNAFRSPGAPTIEKLKERISKTDYFKEIYSNMHRHVISHDKYIDSTNIEKLAGMDFIFLCLDKGKPKKIIVDYLEKTDVQFIDVGMGLHKIDDQLIGIVRITSSTKAKRDHIKDKGRISFSDDSDNEYSKNIQIAELNALNAALAVIKWKKLYGFYQDLEKENFTTYSINVSQLLNEDNDS